jgi:unsaturated chondroitin disaccharide hydrolase
MKNQLRGYISILMLLITLNACKSQQKANQELHGLIDNALETAIQQYLLMAQVLADKEQQLPKTFENGVFVTSGPEWWCSGFFPGTLWYLYEYSTDPKIKKYAVEYTHRVASEQYKTDNHDIGFILNCSFGNGFRLTEDEDYKNVIIQGAKSLAKRFNSKVGAIRSWDWNKHRWQYPIIIDNMMNLELLLNASKLSGNDSVLYHIALSHADITLENHFRADESTYHVVSYDTISGLPELKETFQGYSDSSTWARGQAWALYGYAMMYRKTKEWRYLGQAMKITDFLINHPRITENYIPYWDFDDPTIPNTLVDASAGAIMASAWLDMIPYLEEDLAKQLRYIVEKQLKALCSSDFLAQVGENGNFILKHSVGFLPEKAEVDVPLTYADYYFVEALLRYKQLTNQH